MTANYGMAQAPAYSSKSTKGQIGSKGTLKRGGQYDEYIPKGYQKVQTSQFTPEMMSLFKSLFSHLDPESYLSKLAGGDEETFNQIEEPALRQFGQLQSGLASKFSGMGIGARNSSGFQNTQNQAAADFAKELQAQRQGLQRNASQDLFNMSNMLLNQKPYEKAIQKKGKSFGQELLGSTVPAVAGAATSFGLGKIPFLNG